MIKAIPNLQLFLLLIFISLFTLALDKFEFLSLPKRSLLYLTNPISFGIYRTYQDIYSQFYFVFASRKAGQENKALKEQLGQLMSENATLRKRLAETESLVDQQDYLDPATYNLIAARPVGIQRYLRIDKGSDDGIKVDQAVVFKDNFIGKIVEVTPQSANVLLLHDPDSKVAAFSQGLEGRSRGVLIGQFGTETLMDKILHEEKIEVGDLVYSEGTEGFLPRGLVLGRVIQVLERQNEVFKQAKVKEVFDIRDLEVIFVIVE
ncbi:rod shape-determining protein MreC [Candidatus Daviesbacteria bacterium]|nr:rod shape-determining protein MreC [Candidatus Daviesbacteria bacterium]MBI4035440.1 rod shape-determining protein MreC [Candidatus Daviesbacteria bacterium]